MESYRLPTGDTISLTGTPARNEEFKNIVEARDVFIQKYIKEKGWGPAESISMEQLLEIRSQEGWKNPLKSND